jgi:hypothetical protein
MSIVSLSSTQALRSRRSMSYSSRELALGPVSLASMTIVLGFVLSLFYLSQSNRIATRGYALTGLTNEQSVLRAEHNRLEIEAARLQSIEGIKSKVAQDGSMVPVTQTSYLGEK